MFENIAKNRIIKKVLAFQQTPYYLAALAVISLISNACGIDFLGFYLLGLTAIFTLLFNPDTKPVIAPIAFMIFSVSVKNAPTKENITGFYTSAPVLAQLIFLVGTIVVLIVARFIVKGNFKKTVKGASLTGGLIALSVGLPLNGAFYKGYHILDFAMGLAFAFLFLGVYLFFVHTVEWNKNSIRYLAWFMFIMGILISMQLVVRYLTCGELRALIMTGNSEAKNLVTLGWSFSNSIAYVLLITLPFGFYLMRNAKIGAVYYLLTLLILLAIVFTFSRGSLIIAVPLFIGGMVYTCFAAKEKYSPIIISAVLLLIAMIMLAVFREPLLTALNFYLERGLADSGRFQIWAEGLTEFLVAPIFGLGQMYKFREYFTTFMWYHNTLIQFLVTGGIVGLGTYMYHRVETVILFMKKPTFGRFIIGISLLALLANSMLDVAMSMPHMIFFYSILLAFAEKDFQYAHHTAQLCSENGKIRLSGGKILDAVPKPVIPLKAIGNIVILNDPVSADIAKDLLGEQQEETLPVEKTEKKETVIEPAIEKGADERPENFTNAESNEEPAASAEDRTAEKSGKPLKKPGQTIRKGQPRKKGGSRK